MEEPLGVADGCNDNNIEIVHKEMKMTEMLQAEITATLSRIDLSVTKFSSLFNDVNSLRTSQELIRIKPYLDFCLEEVVHHIDRIDKNREKLIELNFNDWSSRTVIHRNTAISQKFEMKAMLRRFDDLLDSKLMEEKVLQNTTELLEVAKRGANISPDSNLPNTLHNSLRIGSSNSPIEHFASRRDDVSSNTAFDYTTSRTLNISLNSDRRPSMLEQLRSLAPEVSIHEPNKRRRQTGSTEYLNEQQGERLLSGETEPFTTPYKKKVKKVPEPVNIPLDRQSFYNDIPPGAAAPVLFDPRSKEFQIWKKEVKRLDETIGSSLRSYHIPTDLEHLKEDFQRYSRKLSCNSDAEPAAQIAVSQLQSDRISEPAVPPDNNINEPSLPPDQIIANPPKKINCHISPKPIESSEHAANIDEQMMKSHQDATGCQAANPNLCLIETTEGIKDQMEQIHNNLNEDNNSDVERMTTDDLYRLEKESILNVETQILTLKSNMYSELKRFRLSSITGSVGWECLLFFDRNRFVITDVLVFCNHKKKSYNVLLESEKETIVKKRTISCLELVLGLQELAYDANILFYDISDEIDKRIDNLKTNEKHELFAMMGLLNGRKTRSDKNHIRRFKKMRTATRRTTQFDVNDLVNSHIKKLCLDSSFNQTLKTMLRTGEAFPTSFLESYRILAEFDNTFTINTLENGFVDFKRRFEAWISSQRSRAMVVSPIEESPANQKVLSDTVSMSVAESILHSLEFERVHQRVTYAEDKENMTVASQIIAKDNHDKAARIAMEANGQLTVDNNTSCCDDSGHELPHKVQKRRAPQDDSWLPSPCPIKRTCSEDSQASSRQAMEGWSTSQVIQSCSTSRVSQACSPPQPIEACSTPRANEDCAPPEPIEACSPPEQSEACSPPEPMETCLASKPTQSYSSLPATQNCSSSEPIGNCITPELIQNCSLPPTIGEPAQPINSPYPPSVLACLNPHSFPRPNMSPEEHKKIFGSRMLPYRSARCPVNKAPLFTSTSIFTRDDIDFENNDAEVKYSSTRAKKPAPTARRGWTSTRKKNNPSEHLLPGILKDMDTISVEKQRCYQIYNFPRKF